MHYLLPKLHATRNDIWADAISIEGGLPSSAALAGSPTPSPPLLSLWAAGVDGRGQIVGVGDTGADMDSCYLRDPRVDFLSNVHVVGGYPVFTSKLHRKLASYYGFQGGQAGGGKLLRAACMRMSMMVY